MFRALGKFNSRYWPVVLFLWLAAAVALKSVAPTWRSVIQDGEFSFLPAYAPSHVGEDLFKKSFSHDYLGSNILIIVRRLSKDGLTPQDKDFIEKVLKPRLEEIARADGGYTPDDDGLMPLSESEAAAPKSVPAKGAGEEPRRSVITAIRTYTDTSLGHLLDNDDGKASMVMINLRTELFSDQNRAALSRIEKLIDPRNGELRAQKLIPHGLDLAISGSATVGRDMRVAEHQSAKSTEFWTFFLVISLLLIIYRSPLLAAIPLMTVFTSVYISIVILSILAKHGWVHPFGGIDIYITVVCYGAGVDYCVFLMSRYKEELDTGATIEEAVASSIEKVGAAIAASAGTTTLGIGMMIFCQFGKFQQAGIGITLALVLVLIASLTFTPAMMRLFGRWAFWPNMRRERIPARAGWLSPTRFMTKFLESDFIHGFWERVGNFLLRRPGTVFLTALVVMSPFVAVALKYYDVLSYGLMTELQPDVPSVIGAKAVQEHFSPGVTGPVIVLMANPDIDFNDKESSDSIKEFTDELLQRRDEIGLTDIRSLSNPLGVTPAADRADAKYEEDLLKLPAPRRFAERGVRRKKILEHYVSDRGDLARHVTRMDFVFNVNPFSRDSIAQFDRFTATLPTLLPDEMKAGTKLYYIGATASIHDLKYITNQDQVLINILVVAAVFIILWVLLRQIAVSGYLIVSVAFSYLVTLGVTYVVYLWPDPAGFAGLDWKVPVFLFTILIAVGEDYNIYLMARIEEESKRYGKVRGVTVALAKTGGIISTCGVIMAGTFAALMSGTLVGMNQLGFALAFGVMLDTFVVRPVLVPAYLILLHSGRFGWLGQLLGADRPASHDLRPVPVGHEKAAAE